MPRTGGCNLVALNPVTQLKNSVAAAKRRFRWRPASISGRRRRNVTNAALPLATMLISVTSAQFFKSYAFDPLLMSTVAVIAVRLVQSA
jgi:hypothetical protein